MKRTVSYLLIFILVITTVIFTTGCSSKPQFIESGKLNIVCTIFPYYDFARSITGDRAEIKLLLSPGNEPHSYDPSPSDIVAIENCDIFIYNGGESDEWVEDVLVSLQNKNITVLKMTDYVPLRLEQQPDHTDGEEFDEHIWTSVRNAQLILSVISEKAAKCDSANAGYYSENELKYIDQLKELDAKISDIVQNSVKKTVVFGDRFPFLYFVSDYGIDYECAFPGCSSETEPSISTVKRLIDFVRAEEIPVVFYLEFSNGKIAKIIAEDTSAKTLKFCSCHNVTKDEFEEGVSYISLMEQNAENLKEALQ